MKVQRYSQSNVEKLVFKIQKFDLLVALYVFGIMVAELMGAKTMPIATIGTFHITASVAIFVMPLLFTLIDVVVEVDGKERARSIVRSGLIIVILQVLTALLFTALPASKHYASTESAYDSIFGTSVRFGLASVMAFAASEFLDIAVFSKLRQRMHNRSLWLRNNLTNFLSQFIDSTVFVVLAFYTFSEAFGSNFSFIVGIIIPYYLARVAMSIIGTPLVYGGVRWLKPQKPTKKSSSNKVSKPAV